jgi:hypothetical protein
VHAHELLPGLSQQRGCSTRAACSIMHSECSAWVLQECFADSIAAVPQSVGLTVFPVMPLPQQLLLGLLPPFASWLQYWGGGVFW